MTHENGSTHTPKHRGTIIVDTNILFSLITPIPDGFKKPGAKMDNYLGILPFLAANGFKIVIPEEVIWETSRQIIIGNRLIALHDYEHVVPRLDNQFNQKLENSGYGKKLRTFFKDIHNGKYPNISLLSSERLDAKSTKFMANVKTMLESAFGINQSNLQYENILRAVINTCLEQSRDQLADDIIKAQLIKFRAESPDENIYVLTYDKPMLSDIHQAHQEDGKIRLVGIAGLFHGLAEASLLENFGLARGIKADAICHNVIENNSVHKNRWGSGYRPGRRIDRSGAIEFDERLYKGHPPTNRVINDFPFADELKEIAQNPVLPDHKQGHEMNGNGTDAEAGRDNIRFTDAFDDSRDAGHRPPPSQVEKFHKKWQRGSQQPGSSGPGRSAG